MRLGVLMSGGLFMGRRSVSREQRDNAVKY